MKRLAGLWLLASVCALPALAQSPGKAPTLVNLDFKADVQADGHLANVEPDAALAPALQGMLRKQVAGWRYVLGTWQGKPVVRRISQRIVAEAVPVASGGFALRIREVTAVPAVMDAKQMPKGVRMMPPRYPPEAQRQEVEATLIYAMRRDQEGMPIDVELLGAQVPEAWVKQFDAASREAIRQWRLQPVEVDGQAIDCRLVTPMFFRLGTGAPPKVLDPELRGYGARYTDTCPPPPVLETKVAGVLL